MQIPSQPAIIGRIPPKARGAKGNPLVQPRFAFMPATGPDGHRDALRKAILAAVLQLHKADQNKQLARADAEAANWQTGWRLALNKTLSCLGLGCNIERWQQDVRQRISNRDLQEQRALYSNLVSYIMRVLREKHAHLLPNSSDVVKTIVENALNSDPLLKITEETVNTYGSCSDGGVATYVCYLPAALRDALETDKTA